MTIRTGRPCQIAGVPWAIVSFLIGVPASRPKEKQALIIPEKVATRMPFLEVELLDGL